jgi:hypothetical protein
VAARYFGILPNGTAIPANIQAEDRVSTKFFASAANDCNSLPAIASRAMADKLAFLESTTNVSFFQLAARVRQFPEEKQEAAYTAGILLLCGGK